MITFAARRALVAACLALAPACKSDPKPAAAAPPPTQAAAAITAAPVASAADAGLTDGGLASPLFGAPTAANLATPRPAPAAKDLDDKGWPLRKHPTPKIGARVTLPAGHALTELALSPRTAALVVATRADKESRLYRWSGGALEPIAAPSLAGREVTSLAASPFSGELFVASVDAAGGRIDGFAFPEAGASTLGAPRTFYATNAPIARLHAPPLRWDDAPRVFFARAYAPGRHQILSVRESGDGAYELTSPTGQLGLLSDAAMRKPEDSMRRPPSVLKIESAEPTAVFPFTGAVRFVDGRGQLASLLYETNWSLGAQPPSAPFLVPSPNGAFHLEWSAGRAGLELVGPGGAATSLATSRTFERAPIFSPSGRAFVGVVKEGPSVALEVHAVPGALPAARFLSDSSLGEAGQRDLAQKGLAWRGTNADQIYGPYESLRYDACHTTVQEPVFASLDGFLEILHAGFQAVFMLGEENLSRPRLRAFATELARAAQAGGFTRVAEIAAVTRKLLDGETDHPEVALVRAEKPAASRLHTVGVTEPIDFGDFHPRGPYTANEELERYFRAFKYVNLLQLGVAEAAALTKDAALVAAWRAWVDVQAPFLSGTRHKVLFSSSTAPAHVRTDCVPARIRSAPPLVYPLAWGIDSEILESTVWREGVAKDCTVPSRLFPEGLDLATALGSDEAFAAQAAAHAKFPPLRAVHEALRKRFSKLSDGGPFPSAWLAALQRLVGDRFVPEGVDPSLWRRRLVQTALASWTNFRHTTVLVNEIGGVECGDGFDGFEPLTREPPRGAVDPVPMAWRAVAGLLRRLAERTTAGGAASTLREAASSADAFGKMAERQMRGEPLAEEDYARIQKFAGEIEHPYVKLKSLVKREGEGQGEIKKPEPTSKIVDIHSAPGQILHAAVGNPIAITVLLGDRGVLVPVSGAVLSYYEVKDAKRLDDAAWRERLPSVTRPPWLSSIR